MVKSQCSDCYTLYSNNYSDFCQNCGGILAQLSNDAFPHKPVIQNEEEFIAQNNVDKTVRTDNESKDANLASAFSCFLDENKINLKNEAISESESIEPYQFATESILPPDEVQQGWSIQGNPIPSPKGYDQWLITKRTGTGTETRAIFRRFTTGALSTQKTYDAILEQTGRDTLVKLYSHGTVQTGGGARADYEIVAESKGIPLNVWLKDKGLPGEELTLCLVKPLVDFLERLRNIGLMAISLSPHMLCLSEDKTISLTDLGALALRDDASNAGFCADLSNSALLPFPYTAPEITGRRVVTNNSDVFSLGQILSESLYGEPQDYTFIAEGSIAFASIGDKTIRSILMGVLWPSNEERWGIDDLVKMIKSSSDMPKFPPWSRLRPGAAKSAFTLGGEGYFLPEDLCVGFVEHWNEAIFRLDELFQWLENTRFAGQSRMILQMRNGGWSADWTLIKIRTVILPDAPAVWRGLSLGNGYAQASLIQLAQQALSEGDGYRQAQELLELLFTADLRDAFTSLQ